MKSAPSPAAPAAPAAPIKVPPAIRRHPFVAHVDRNLRRRCAVAPGTTAGPVVVGVSGGADSIALLVACAALRDRARDAGRVLPVAAHVHHHLRDESADADAAHVAARCDELGVELHVEHVHPGDHPGNTAARARDLRYAALAGVARRVGAAYVAVAHHGDDQLETMLIALGRGAGPDGLDGMPWTRPIDGRVTLVRPLLDVERTATEAFCHAADVTWRDDPANRDPARLRARLRAEVMPLIRELWPHAGRRATASADAIRAHGAGVDHLLGHAFGPAGARSWPRADLAALPVSLVAAGLRRAALDEAPDAGDALDHRHLRDAADAIRAADPRPRRFDWPGGLTLEVRARGVHLTTRTASPAPPSPGASRP